jgi:hypothetical protein
MKALYIVAGARVRYYMMIGKLNFIKNEQIIFGAIVRDFLRQGAQLRGFFAIAALIKMAKAADLKSAEPCRTRDSFRRQVDEL